MPVGREGFSASTQHFGSHHGNRSHRHLLGQDSFGETKCLKQISLASSRRAHLYQSGMAQKKIPSRRKFLKSGMLASAAAMVRPAAAAAQQAAGAPAEVEVLTTDSCGSDYMVDVIKSLGFEYVCANPGSSFRGIHESIINYGGNR